MSWAARRRFIILLIVGSVAIAFLSVILISVFSKTPSCADGIENQGENGVDCGGPCAYLCTEQMKPPVVLFTQAIPNGEGRTDVIAMVENRNATAAAKNVPYKVTLYDAKRIFVKEVEGFVDLPPNSRMPVYIRGIVSGNQNVTNAFLEISASSPRWFAINTDPRVLPTVVTKSGGGDKNAPRVAAILANPTSATISNVKVIALVLDIDKDVIGVSETLIPAILPQSEETAIFTWNSAFDGTPESIEAIPVIPLP